MSNGSFQVVDEFGLELEMSAVAGVEDATCLMKVLLVSFEDDETL